MASELSEAKDLCLGSTSTAIAEVGRDPAWLRVVRLSALCLTEETSRFIWDDQLTRRVD